MYQYRFSPSRSNFVARRANCREFLSRACDVGVPYDVIAYDVSVSLEWDSQIRHRGTLPVPLSRVGHCNLNPPHKIAVIRNLANFLSRTLENDNSGPLEPMVKVVPVVIWRCGCKVLSKGYPMVSLDWPNSPNW